MKYSFALIDKSPHSHCFPLFRVIYSGNALWTSTFIRISLESQTFRMREYFRRVLTKGEWKFVVHFGGVALTVNAQWIVACVLSVHSKMRHNRNRLPLNRVEHLKRFRLNDKITSDHIIEIVALSLITNVSVAFRTNRNRFSSPSTTVWMRQKYRGKSSYKSSSKWCAASHFNSNTRECGTVPENEWY